MKELIKFMLQKKNELLKEIEILKDSSNLKEEDKRKKLNEYNKKVEEVQNQIEQRKKILKDQIKEKIVYVQTVTETVKIIYPKELSDTIYSLEEKRRELKELKTSPEKNYLLIKLCEENIKSLEERFKILQEQIKKGKSKLESIVGKRKDETNYLLNLYNELELIDKLNFKNISKIENVKIEILDIDEKAILKQLDSVKQWCEKMFKEKNTPKYLRRFPRQTILDEQKNHLKLNENEKSPEQQELSAGHELKKVKSSKFFVAYKNGIIKEDMSDKEKQIIDLYEQLVEEYDYRDINTLAQNLLDIKQWCEQKFKNRPIYERRVPRATIKNKNILSKKYRNDGVLEESEEEELRLGTALSNFKGSMFFKKVNKLGKNNIKSGEKELIDLYENILQEYRIDENIANLLELKQWYEEHKKENRKPRTAIQIGKVRIKVASNEEKINGLETNLQKEIRLGKSLQFIESTYVSKSMKKEKLAEQEKEIVTLYYEVQNKLLKQTSEGPEF